jgi:hypothetical protein
MSRIDIRCGWIPETFRGLESNRYAFAHLDVDLLNISLLLIAANIFTRAWCPVEFCCLMNMRSRLRVAKKMP